MVFMCILYVSVLGCGPPEIKTGFVPWGNRDGLWGVTFGADWETRIFDVGDRNGLSAEIAYYHWRPGRNVLACSVGPRLSWMVTDEPKELRTRDSSSWRFFIRPALGYWFWPQEPENTGPHFAFTLGLDRRLSEFSLVGIDYTLRTGKDLLTGAVARYSIEF